jgi:hypothetical protein
MNSRLASSVGLIALEEDRANRFLHRPGVVQRPANLVLHRPDDLTVELPDDVGDIPSCGVEPGQMDQDGGERYCQQHEAGQHRSQPELMSRSDPWRCGGVCRRSLRLYSPLKLG